MFNLFNRLAAAAAGTSQAAPTAATQYVTAEPYLAASNNIGPVPGYGVCTPPPSCSATYW